MRIAAGSVSWIMASLAATALLLFASVPIYTGGGRWFLALPLASLLFTLFLFFFFRDPVRSIGAGIVAPADGKVQFLDRVSDSDVGDAVRLSVFMNLHNVHVNRFPLAGRVISVERAAGKHLPAFDKDSERNERAVILMETGIGTVKLVQIAGAVARRIYPYVKGGESVRKGDKLGLIRLGSRFDIYVPFGGAEFTVKVGDRVLAGLTSIGRTL
ncbi:MAG: phosphatidylserine decarboxylase family protein [Thermoplasmata archaeon HGW-Thermoplasmata-1]|nr:MAG: phosphatidylserine decarboxylase family protein [Thermoplasmata archaeon HGW-Thermoplasmata-1]